MGKYCADCSNFKPKDKKADGFCKCSKTGKYMFGNIPACEKFSEAYTRGWYEREKLYDDGKKTMNKPTPSNVSTGTYVVLAIFLIILAVILNIFMK